MTRKKVLGPSDLVGSWYDLKAEIDKGANRLSGMVAQAEKLRVRLEQEFGIAVPALSVRIGAETHAVTVEVPIIAGDNEDDEGAQLPLDGGYRPPTQRAVEMGRPSTVAVSAEEAVKMIREGAALSEEAGADEQQFARGVAGMLSTIKKTMQ